MAVITVQKLRGHFFPVEELGGDLIRCADELPGTTFYTYFLTGPAGKPVPFVVSENLVDDDFARMVLQMLGDQDISRLTKKALQANSYGFSHILFVPPAYHSELKGRLDAERSLAVLCIPIFEAEFSGTETPDEFIALRRRHAATSHWDRDPMPKISLRFDNPATKSGTGEGYVFTGFDGVAAEIERLNGAPGGFIEVINFRNDIAEIVVDLGVGYSWIPNRTDSNAQSVSPSAIRDKLRSFVTGRPD